MKLIVAVDKNWAIGKNNKLMWSIPADMKFFRETTKGNVVIMGRKTLESFPQGQPLKGRGKYCNHQKSCLSGERSRGGPQRGRSGGRKQKSTKGDVFVIGGESIYRAMLDQCDTALVTKIDHAYDADTVFS